MSKIYLKKLQTSCMCFAFSVMSATAQTTPAAEMNVPNVNLSQSKELVSPKPAKAPRRVSANGVYTQKLDSIITDLIRYYYLYDKDGNIVVEESYFKNNNSWEGSNKCVRKYDNRGNCISVQSYYWDYNKWESTKKLEYAYDDNNNQTLCVVYRLKGDTWYKDSQEEYGYNSQGKQIMYKKYSLLDGIWTGTDYYVREYDENNNQINNEEYYWENGDWVGFQKWEYAFDANNNQTMQARYDWKDGAWVGFNKTEYGYDANGYRTMNAYYSWENGGWVGTSKNSSVYDDNRRTIEMNSYSWNKGVETDNWYLTSNTVYTYSGKSYRAYRAVSTNYSLVDNVSTCVNRAEGEYDENGSNIYEAYYNYIDGAFVGKYKWEKDYSDGKVVAYRNYSWKDGAWALSTSTEYTYDGNKLTCEAEYSWIGDVKTLTSETELTISEDGVYTLVYNKINYVENESGVEVQRTPVGIDERVYDKNGNMISWTTYNEKVDDHFVPNEKHIYSYDSMNHQILYESYLYREGAWICQHRVILAYDEYGNQTLHECYSMIDSEFVGIDQKKEYAYDANGNQTMSASYEWIDGKWQGVKDKYVSTYNANGKILEEQYYNWYDDDWHVYHKNEHQYDDSGNMTLSAGYDYDSKADIWVGTNKHEYQYDDNHYQTMTASYTWNYNSNSWVGNRMSEYEFNAKGKSIMWAHYIWDAKINGWVGDGLKTIHEEDDNGNNTLLEYYQWVNNTWEGTSKYEYSYDENGNTILAIHYRWEKDSWFRSYKEESVFDKNNNVTERCWYYLNDKQELVLDGGNFYSYNEYGDLSSSGYFNSQKQVTASSKYVYDLSVPSGSVAGLTGYTHKLLLVDSEGGWVNKTYYYSDFIVGDVTLAVNSGWNWISLPISAEGINNARNLVDNLGNIEYIASQTATLYNDEKMGWFGDLSTISPVQSYKIHSLNSETVELPLSGCVGAGAISLNTGWTWVGYNNILTQSISDALPEAVEGDVIKSKDSFATYTNGAWVGNLMMTPGQGYKYHTASARKITYNTVAASPAKTKAAKDVTLDNSVFVCDNSRYSDNTAIIAKINVPAESDRYVVGAFVGDECRGCSRQNAALQFITVHGNAAGEKIEFRLYDTVTGETVNVKETAVFNNGVIGTVSNPFMLTADNATGIENVETENAVSNMYDMQGRRLHAAPAAGLYISNGKKIVKK